MLFPSQDLTDPAALRMNYQRASLDVTDVHPNPLVQFHRWFQDVISAQLLEPNAMFLATVGEGGLPAGRMVLLKGYDANGFVFYTNYESRKAHHLERHPHCALTFWWAELERQLRIEGVADRIPVAESRSYFQRRPRGSQVGAWASPQSRVLPTREALIRQFEQTEERFANTEVLEVPPFWGGYRVVPRLLEFWQGRENRLHDRVVYELQDNGSWERFRLAP